LETPLWVAIEVPKDGYDLHIKKRFIKKHMYKQEDIKIQLLEPFDNGTIIDKEMSEELILANYITRPEVGIWMPPDTQRPTCMMRKRRPSTMVSYMWRSP
jgi:hypothetical protein